MPVELRSARHDSPPADQVEALRAERIESENWQRLKALRLRALEDSPLAFFGSLAHEKALADDAWRERCDSAYWISAGVGDDYVGLAGVVDYPKEFPRFHVEGMWVDPRYRRTGVGIRLLEEAERHVKSLNEDRLGLWIIMGNSGVLAFYKRFGYSPTSRRAPVGDGREEHEYDKYLLAL